MLPYQVVILNILNLQAGTHHSFSSYSTSLTLTMSLKIFLVLVVVVFAKVSQASDDKISKADILSCIFGYKGKNL